MKAEFNLNLDSNGIPCIKFRHHDKDNSLEQKALKVFLDAAKEKGCVLRNSSSYLESGTSNSWNNYEIQISNVVDISNRRELLLDFLSEVNENLMIPPQLQRNERFIDNYLTPKQI